MESPQTQGGVSIYTIMSQCIISLELVPSQSGPLNLQTFKQDLNSLTWPVRVQTCEGVILMIDDTKSQTGGLTPVIHVIVKQWRGQ